MLRKPGTLKSSWNTLSIVLLACLLCLTNVASQISQDGLGYICEDLGDTLAYDGMYCQCKFNLPNINAIDHI